MARRRPRNRNQRPVDSTPQQDATTAAEPTADDVLEGSKGKFQHAIVLGITKDGLLEVASTIHSYPFIHWHLNKAAFQLNVHENNALTASRKEPKNEAE